LIFSAAEQDQYEIGKRTIDTFYRNLPAIKKLKDKIDERITTKGYLIGIDGRHLQIRSRHSALNQLLAIYWCGISEEGHHNSVYTDLNGLGLSGLVTMRLWRTFMTKFRL
jgi:hypothetical protein